MLQTFGNLRSVLRNSRCCTESLVFYLHYHVTFLVLMFCCILVSTHQFIGEKIQCGSKSSESINTELLKTYCWSASTYSVTSGYLKEIGVHIPHAGVYGSEKEDEYEYRNFYQYVHIVLFIQAIFFYIPHALWKGIEQNFINSLPVGINNIKTVRESTGTNSESPLDSIAVYLKDRWGSHKPLVFMYFACEILAAFNVLGQTYLLDVFFHGRFLNMGLLFEAYYNASILEDPLELFPLVTVCNFRRYGPSGYIDEINTLCVLPLNAINGKIFLCIWIWFTVLMLLSLVNIVHLLLSIMIPVYRLYIAKIDFWAYLNGMNNNSYLKLIELSDFGDWFVLTSIKKNTDELNYCQLTDNILSRINSLDIELKEEKEITDA